MSTPRFGLYFAPEPGSALAQFGWSWLGRDPAKAALLPLLELGFDSARHAEVVAQARCYGFHATLKPPFRLAEGLSLAELRADLAKFAENRRPFVEPPLALEELDGFLALRPSASSAAIHDLADACVRQFDRFRAPAGAAEVAKRLAADQTERQRRSVVEWGYPYVFEDYRFHMTLTCRLDGAERALWRSALADRLDDAVLAEPVAFRSLCLFTQADAEASFVLAERFPFGG